MGDGMKDWILTLLLEKGVPLESTIIQVDDAPSGLTNYIPLQVLVEHICSAPLTEQREIKFTLVKIDFYNGDIMHFLTHLARAIAI